MNEEDNTMMNHILFSAPALIMSLTSATVACEAMSADPHPIIKYKDCSQKVAQTFKTRVANIETTDQKEREADLRHLIQIAKHEQERCKKTCMDAPQQAPSR
jgi:hypothetical protein